MSIARADWPRLLTLVEQALDQPVSARTAWVDTLGLSEPLKAALLGLLEERRAIETGDFLGALPAIAPASPAPAAGRLLPGTLVGPWRLLREVGQGGMSTVWLAERADDQVTRQVALKLPHAGPGQDLLAARLLRERNILAALEHRNIARLYDVGLTDAGTPYLVMEYVAGDTLLAHADRLKLNIPQRLALFQQVLRAVQYAHGKLVLHRDLKPSNILVNEAGDVKLLDFGIAKLLATEGHTRDDTELTRSAGRQLTPAYASPEQLRGEALGTASDVYSLGVVLHELLSGERPFARHSGSALRMEDAVLHQEARAPSRLTPTADTLAARACSATQLKKTLAGDLDAIVLKSLGKTAAERYASVDPLAADVAHWLADKPVSVTAPSTWYHLRKFVLRHRLGVSLGSAVGLIVVSLAVLAWAQAREAELQAMAAISTRDFMIDVFRDTDPDFSAGNELSGKALLFRSRDRLLKSGPGQESPYLVDLLSSVGEAQSLVGDRPAADETFALVLQRLPKDTRHRDRRAGAWLSRAENALQSRDYKQAATHIAALREEVAPTKLSRKPQQELARIEGHIALHRNDAKTAQQALTQYIELAADSPVRPLEDLVARLSLAVAESRLGHRDKAFDQLAIAEQFFETNAKDIPGLEFRELAAYRVNIEVFWGQYQRTQRWLPGVIDRCDQQLGIGSGICLDLKNQQVRILLKLGEHASAVRLVPDLMRSVEDNGRPERQLDALVSVARALSTQQTPVPLTSLLTQLAQWGSRDHDTGRSPREQALALNTLSEITLSSEGPTAAITWAERALKALEPNTDPSAQRERMKANLLRGIALQRLGQSSAAIDAMGPFCDPEHLAADRLQVLARLFSLNCIAPWLSLGRPEKAMSLLQPAIPVLEDGMGITSPTMLRITRLKQQTVEAATQGTRAAARPSTDIPAPFL